MNVKENAKAHSAYTFELIDLVIRLTEWLYEQAFIHGYKHGISDKETS